MTQLLLLFLAGGLGTLARFGLNTVIGVHDYPYGTSLINAVGCLLFGVALGLANDGALSKENGMIVMVGFLGAFTTFSAFAAEAVELWRGARFTQFFVYLAAQNILGLLFVALGLRFVR